MDVWDKRVAGMVLVQLCKSYDISSTYGIFPNDSKQVLRLDNTGAWVMEVFSLLLGN